MVNVEIERYPNRSSHFATGRVVEVIGFIGDPGVDIEVVVRKHHIPHLFPPEVIAEAESIPQEVPEDEIAKRVDLRDRSIVTIDGETAKDFDDAVEVQILKNGNYLLGVHIADVAHYVTEGSELDKEAFERATSVYFPERAIPMLPERLSNGICSLNPNVDRLTMSALMELDRTGRIVDYQLTPSVIHSRERMTYTTVNDILTNQEGELRARYQNVGPMLAEMHELTLILIERRRERGAIDFDLPEAELFFNDEGQIGGIVRSERNIAHRMIEEFMLLANETVARHLEALD